MIKGMVVQAKFADSHIDDTKTMEKDENDEKVSIQPFEGSENKSFEKNENEANQKSDEKISEKNPRISTTENESEEL